MKQVKGYPDAPKTLGEHLRKRRLDLRETQAQAAARFGISSTAYNGWEADRIAPNISKWPEVVRFLGYDPTPAPTNFDEALTALQRRHGLPREVLAVRLGIERKTLFNWLGGRTTPSSEALRKLGIFNLPGAEALRLFVAFRATRSAAIGDKSPRLRWQLRPQLRKAEFPNFALRFKVAERPKHQHEYGGGRHRWSHGKGSAEDTVSAANFFCAKQRLS
jgi:transcriptional regulator with XRE-family HTH domain